MDCSSRATSANRSIIGQSTTIQVDVGISPKVAGDCLRHLRKASIRDCFAQDDCRLGERLRRFCLEVEAARLLASRGGPDRLSRGTFSKADCLARSEEHTYELQSI